MTSLNHADGPGQEPAFALLDVVTASDDRGAEVVVEIRRSHDGTLTYVTSKEPEAGVPYTGVTMWSAHDLHFGGRRSWIGRWAMPGGLRPRQWVRVTPAAEDADLVGRRGIVEGTWYEEDGECAVDVYMPDSDEVTQFRLVELEPTENFDQGPAVPRRVETMVLDAAGSLAPSGRYYTVVAELAQCL